MNFSGPTFRDNDRLGPVAVFTTDEGATSEWKPVEAATLVMRVICGALGYGDPAYGSRPAAAEAPSKPGDPVD